MKAIRDALWKRKVTVLACVVVATVMGGSSALAANGGNFILATNNTATLATFMTAAVPGAASLIITNPSTTAGSTALDLRVTSGKAPLKVNSDVKVTNLNADRVDGKDSSDFLQSSTPVYEKSHTFTGTEGTILNVEPTCDAGDKAVGGGFAAINPDHGQIVQSRPKPDGRGYMVAWFNNPNADTGTTGDDVFSSVLCADFGTRHTTPPPPPPP